MEKKLTCSIVKDLLTNYIEKLTSHETNIAIEEHLENCVECKKAYKEMTADIDKFEKPPVIELKFFKKVKKTRLLAAALCVVLTLLLSYLLYASEYNYTIDKSDLSAAITEYTTNLKTPINAYVLETKEIEGVLIVSFKDQSRDDVYGIAKFLKGFNQRYRIVQTKVESSDYSSVVQIYRLTIKDEQYIGVNGYNLSDEIMYYGLDYDTYSNPGYQAKNRVTKSIKFEVKNPQFLELYNKEKLDSFLEESVEGTLSNYHLVETSMYDANGMNITENYRTTEDVGGRVSSGGGKAELFMLYVYMAIIIGLGYIFTRYFLTE